jgi:hypothetical protein
VTTAGKLLSVDVYPAGSLVAETGTIGRIPVYEVWDFSPDGGTVKIDDVVYAYEGTDEETSELLGAALPTPPPETLVLVEPYAETRMASVSLNDEGDWVQALVPHTLSALLEEGTRDPGNLETVTVVQTSPGLWEVADVLDQRAELTPDAGALLPGGSDGNPPAASPDPTAIGGIGAVYVRWTALDNPDFVSYAVHVSTSPDYVPDETTLVALTNASSLTVRTDGAGAPLAYDTAYYFAIVASDADGSAAPSAVASAQLFKVTGPDIAADYVYAGTVLADQIIGGNVQADIGLFGTLKTADAGARVELGPFGFIVYNSAGVPTTLLGSDGISTFKGSVIASTFSVTDGMSIRGTNNELAQAGSLTLAAGVSAAANAPTVVCDYEIMPGWKTELGAAWPAGHEFKTMQRSGTKWVVGSRQTSNDQFFVRTFNDDGSFDAYYGVGWLGQQIQRGVYLGAGYPVYGFRNTDRRIVAATHSTNGGPVVNSLAWDFEDGLQPAGTTEVGTVSYSIGSVKIDATSGVPDSALETTDLLDMRGRRVTAKAVKLGTFSSAGQVIELRMRNPGAGEYILVRYEGATGTGTVKFQTYNGSPGSTKTATAAVLAGYDWWRMTESNGDAKLQVSTDGNAWSTVATITDHGLTDSDLSAMSLGLVVRAGDGGQASSARFDNVSIGAGFVDYGDNIAWSDASNPPALGTDGTFILAAERTSDNRIKIHQINPRSPGRIVQTFTSGVSTDFAFVTPLTTVAWGSFDFGSARFVVATGNSGEQWAAVFSVSGTTLTYQRNESFYIPGQGGTGWDGTAFQTMATDGVRRKHTSITWTDVPEWAKTWYGATTWYDGDATGGTHETTPSPRAAFTFRKRQRYTITSGTIPDLGGTNDPDRIRIYLASSAVATLWRQATTAAGINSAVLTAALFSGTSAPVSNDFPGAIAAKIINAGSSLIVSGDGTIKGTTIEATTELKSPLATLDRLTLTGWLVPVQVDGPTVNYDTSNVEADVPQLTTTITVPGTWARYRVVVDLAVGSFGSGQFNGYLNVNGVNNPRVLVTAATASGNRQQPSRTYIVTGLAAGSRTFKVRGASSAASPNNHRLYAGQCTLTVEQII